MQQRPETLTRGQEDSGCSCKCSLAFEREPEQTLCVEVRDLLGFLSSAVGRLDAIFGEPKQLPESGNKRRLSLPQRYRDFERARKSV
jgi:hypothetical protein